MKWVTTCRPHVDRCATAWLVRRFIDPDATFVFVRPGEALPPDAVPYDMPGARFGHEGGLCTFQVVARQHHTRNDDALAHLGELIADLDFRRGRKAETKLMDQFLLGLAIEESDDHRLVEKAGIFFDALYAYASQAPSQTKRAPT